MNLSKDELILLICEYTGCRVGSIRHKEIKKFVDDKRKKPKKMRIMGEERERFNASAWRDFENAINDIYIRLNELES